MGRFQRELQNWVSSRNGIESSIKQLGEELQGVGDQQGVLLAFLECLLCPDLPLRKPSGNLVQTRFQNDFSLECLPYGLQSRWLKLFGFFIDEVEVNMASMVPTRRLLGFTVDLGVDTILRRLLEILVEHHLNDVDYKSRDCWQQTECETHLGLVNFSLPLLLYSRSSRAWQGRDRPPFKFWFIPTRGRRAERR